MNIKFVEKCLKMPHAQEVGFYLVENEKVYVAIHDNGTRYFNSSQSSTVDEYIEHLNSDNFIELPRAVVNESQFNIGDTKLTGSVLNDGRRVIKDTSLFSALDRTRKGETRIEGFPPIIGSKSLATLLTEMYPQYLNQIMPFEVAQFNGSTGKWYDANTIPIICDLYMEAEKQGLISVNQAHVLERAKVLLRSLAKVGITALIDEATNYQEVRGKDELQLLLEQFIAEELRPYSKEFKSEYFEQLFKLYGLPYDPTTSKRPLYFAKFTRKYVYDLLPPNVWVEIDKQNPLLYDAEKDRSKRKYHIHRLLSEEHGIRYLREHLESLIPVMKLSKNMNDFKLNFEEVYADKIRKIKQMQDKYQLTLEDIDSNTNVK
ncbi:P63C domain-containing protein [Sporosarcina gallistercoris]|uniref:P63C domain-containing protein n=1 Tax=Sporosarcina gallistercoris TaxID=2762245 RepID=UPI003D2BAD77